MSKIYTDKNVLEAALERLEIAFNNFDNIYFSVSGGKDSSVMVQLANKVAKKMNKKFDVLYIDLEAQYKYTIEHIEELKQLSQIRDFYHIALPIALRNAISVLQPKWICWEEESKHLWVRDMPKDAINIDNCPFPWFEKGEEFEEFITLYFQLGIEEILKGNIPEDILLHNLSRVQTIIMCLIATVSTEEEIENALKFIELSHQKEYQAVFKNIWLKINSSDEDILKFRLAESTINERTTSHGK